MKKIDDARKRIEDAMALSASKMVDKEIINSFKDSYKPTVADDKIDPLTYYDLRRVQEKMARPYNFKNNGIDSQEFPVLHAFMNMPSIGKHIKIKMDSPSASDPYAIHVNIDYNIPIEEEHEYKKGLHDFIMNYISDKSLNDHEMEIFKKIAQDMSVEPKTLDDINDIINQI